MMNFLTAALVGALASAVVAIPPEDFGLGPSAPNDTALTVVFNSNGNSTIVQEGELFGAGITMQQPILAMNTPAYRDLANYTGQYFVLMIDPDARYPQDPNYRWYLHWAQPNMTQTKAMQANIGGQMELQNATAPFVPFTQPAPPTNSSAHRYMLYAFVQPDNFTIPSAWKGYSAENRTNFNFTTFLKDTGLGIPAAAQYFYVSNETAVPQDFIALPGGTYPGGNGQAIFSGPGPAITPTSSTSASGASMSMTSTASAGSASASAGGSASAGMSSGSGSSGNSSDATLASPWIGGSFAFVAATVLGLAALL